MASFTVASQAAMLALTTAVAGDICKRTDSREWKILDNKASSTLLQMHMDGANNSTTFTDSKGAKTFTRTGVPVISTANSKFGGASAYFPSGAANYITTPYSADFDFGTANDFTIEFWFKRGSTTLATHIIGVNSQWSIFANSSAGVGIFYNLGGWMCNPCPATPDTNWHHYAFVRYRGVVNTYYDGIKYDNGGNTGVWAYPIIGNGNPLTIGVDASVGVTTASGQYIDELRISNSARYLSNFIVQTTAFVDSFTAGYAIEGNWTNYDAWSDKGGFVETAAKSEINTYTASPYAYKFGNELNYLEFSLPSAATFIKSGLAAADNTWETSFSPNYGLSASNEAWYIPNPFEILWPVASLIASGQSYGVDGAGSGTSLTFSWGT